MTEIELLKNIEDTHNAMNVEWAGGWLKLQNQERLAAATAAYLAACAALRQWEYENGRWTH